MSQQSEALAKANAIRLRQAQVKRELYACTRPESLRMAADLIAAPGEEAVERMRLEVLLGAVRRVGDSKAVKLMNEANIGRTRRLTPIGRLTEHEKLRLVKVLHATADKARPRRQRALAGVGAAAFLVALALAGGVDSASANTVTDINCFVGEDAATHCTATTDEAERKFVWTIHDGFGRTKIKDGATVQFASAPGDARVCVVAISASGPNDYDPPGTKSAKVCTTVTNG